jgi:hypothetical protein
LSSLRPGLAARAARLAAELCKQFKSAKDDRIAEWLATLAALGHATSATEERFVA